MKYLITITLLLGLTSCVTTGTTFVEQGDQDYVYLAKDHTVCGTLKKTGNLWTADAGEAGLKYFDNSQDAFNYMEYWCRP